jgi:hypothetical protein
MVCRDLRKSDELLQKNVFLTTFVVVFPFFSRLSRYLTYFSLIPTDILFDFSNFFLLSLFAIAATNYDCIFRVFIIPRIVVCHCGKYCIRATVAN